MEPKSKDKSGVIISVSLMLVAALLMVFSVINTQSENPSGSVSQITPDESAVAWEGARAVLIESNSHGGIAVPGFSTLHFAADECTQQVNLYNPESNTCYFIFEIFIEGELMWESGYCQPGDGYYEITLENPCSAGFFSGEIRVLCYSVDGERLNSARFPVEITVT